MTFTAKQEAPPAGEKQGDREEAEDVWRWGRGGKGRETGKTAQE
jgi:hypothetical protein